MPEAPIRIGPFGPTYEFEGAVSNTADLGKCMKELLAEENRFRTPWRKAIGSKAHARDLSSLLALLEGRGDEAVRLMEATDTTREPEILVYFARHYGRMKLADSAVRALKQAAQSGFVCAPNTLNSDAWLSALRKHPEFGSLVSTAETLIEEARSSFDTYAASQ